MEKSSKRGKIPQSDWPLIMARYEAGETLASIARTYDCSPPAISYVVSRSRARVPDPESQKQPAAPSEPQLIKSAAGEVAAAGVGKPLLPGTPTNGQAAPPSVAQRQAETDTHPARPDAAIGNPGSDPGNRRDLYSPRGTNGFARNDGGERTPQSPGVAPLARAPLIGPQHTNGPDQRRTLHLSLGNNPGGNGNSHQPEVPSTGRPEFANRSEPAAAVLGASHPGRDAVGPAGFSQIQPTFDEPVRRNGGDNPARKEAGGAFIDKELRARVDGDIAAFLAAFDAALVQDTQESRSALREATDRLLRAGARTRIELERLEARLPLPARDNRAGGEPAWRHR